MRTSKSGQTCALQRRITYLVTILASDGTYSASQSFNWTINSPVTITAPDSQSNSEGDTVSLTISATVVTRDTDFVSTQGLSVENWMS